MRIIAGSYRGRKLVAPKDQTIRPTMDRAKEGLFNVINQDIVGIDFLDLFAGTGSVGLEALSRGANFVLFVEKDYSAIKLIKENAKGINKEHKIVRNEVIPYLNYENNKYDYIFLDPPYFMEISEIEKIVKLIKDREILKKDGQIIIEFHAKKKLEFVDYDVVKFKKYGISAFTFLKEKNE